MSFSFGTPKTATGFSLAGNTNTTTAPTTTGGMGDVSNVQNKPSLLFGTLPQSTSFPGLGTAFTTTTTTAPTFGFTPTTVSSNAATTGFRLSAPPVTSSTAGFNLGATTTPTTLGFGTSAPAAKTTIGASAAPQFSLGASTISTTTTATAAAAATTSASFTPILGIATTNAASTTSSAIPLKIGSSNTTTATSTPTITTGLSLGTTSTTTSAIATTTAITTTTTTTIPQTGTLTYAQLEDSINKWTIDLEEQGKLFINQAKELNAWDNLLISNGEKMVQLNETIERVKQQQKQLDEELDFVLAQQNELDELSLPLEKQLADIPITDQNRFQMYQLSEIIDSQLKQMSEDLKEIVEHLNESNKNEDTSDPVIQISRILNAHMNSLQWIDRNTTQITAHLEQISKLQDFHKKNQLNYQ